jgi:hypothetical protein
MDYGGGKRMTVKELIEVLSTLNPHASVYVWEGYDAGIMTTDFTVYIDDNGDVLLEP